MDQESIIADIERRAREAGISIQLLCSHALVHPTTFSRWKRSERNPEPIGANLHSIGRLYAALNVCEAEQAEHPPRRAVRA